MTVADDVITERRLRAAEAEIERLTAPVDGLETTAEARAYLAHFFDATPSEEREDTWTARFVGRALLRDHATLTARLAAAAAGAFRLDTAIKKVEGELAAERTAREALEAALRDVEASLPRRHGWSRLLSVVRAALSPEPEGTVEEPPRDNSITDA